MTSSRLRELSRLASPAPWEVGRTSINGEALLQTDKVNDFSSRSVQMQTVNAALVVALRNDAEKYADLRDAGKDGADDLAALIAIVDRLVGDDSTKGAKKALHNLRAALAALGGEE